MLATGVPRGDNVNAPALAVAAARSCFKDLGIPEGGGISAEQFERWAVASKLMN